MMALVWLGLHLVFVMGLGYYLATALQWYHYRVKRVVFHFHKPQWHVFFLIIPVAAYYVAGVYVWFYVIVAFFPMLVLWARKLDKPLVFTARVKRFFAFLFFATLFQDVLCLAAVTCAQFGVLMPLIATVVLSSAYEKLLFQGFYKKAKTKLAARSALKIVAITASYGKTSMKNFLAHILGETFVCYATPRSVNTLGGLVQDVNTALPENTQVYIAEAGAREPGDILEITRFLEPHVALVGEIGPQHIEYFKTLEAVRNTKMELVYSPRLEKAFVHQTTNTAPSERVRVFGGECLHVEATLEGTRFEAVFEGEKRAFATKLLGAFHATNLIACIHVARHFGLSFEHIAQQIASLEPVPHRLCRMDAGGKIILDDSFNGNFEGMRASYELVRQHQGRKVLVTPGIIESTKEENIALAEVMNEVFDVVMVTGQVNATTLMAVLKKPQVHLLKDKSQMEPLLATHTRAGDLILFSNDAPSFI
ncbi:Mur ligase family protein [Sulfurospirillum tamanense]|nr:UDP-N-acetylmuramoyl-tripeptide--D-alanyl-D-alanine ligase [Sulfurospirillum tamanensis]